MAFQVEEIRQDDGTTYSIVVRDSSDMTAYRASFDIRDGVSDAVNQIKAQVISAKSVALQSDIIKKAIEDELNLLDVAKIEADAKADISAKLGIKVGDVDVGKLL